MVLLSDASTLEKVVDGFSILGAVFAVVSVIVAGFIAHKTNNIQKEIQSENKNDKNNVTVIRETINSKILSNLINIKNEYYKNNTVNSHMLVREFMCDIDKADNKTENYSAMINLTLYSEESKLNFCNAIQYNKLVLITSEFLKKSFDSLDKQECSNTEMKEILDKVDRICAALDKLKRRLQSIPTFVHEYPVDKRETHLTFLTSWVLPNLEDKTNKLYWRKYGENIENIFYSRDTVLEEKLLEETFDLRLELEIQWKESTIAANVYNEMIRIENELDLMNYKNYLDYQYDANDFCERLSNIFETNGRLKMFGSTYWNDSNYVDMDADERAKFTYIINKFLVGKIYKKISYSQWLDNKATTDDGVTFEIKVQGMKDFKDAKNSIKISNLPGNTKISAAKVLKNKIIFKLTKRLDYSTVDEFTLMFKPKNQKSFLLKKVHIMTAGEKYYLKNDKIEPEVVSLKLSDLKYNETGDLYSEPKYFSQFANGYGNYLYLISKKDDNDIFKIKTKMVNISD